MGQAGDGKGAVKACKADADMACMQVVCTAGSMRRK